MSVRKINLKKIIHIAPTPFFSDRGCHIRIDGVVRLLNQQGFHNIICTYHHGRERIDLDTRRVTKIPFYNSTTAGFNWCKPLADIKLLWLVVITVWRERPEILHAHLHEGVIIGYLVRWIFFWRRIALVADMQGSLVGELTAAGLFHRKSFLSKFFSLVEYLVLRMAKHTFCSSANCLQLFHERYKLPMEKLSLLTDRVQVPTAVSAKNLILPPLICYSGSLLDSKGLNELKQSILLLAKQRPDVKWLIIGYPISDMEKFILRHKLESQVELTGRVLYEDLPSYLGRCWFGVDPKCNETGEGSGKIINYMAAALPIVAFDTANNRELVGINTELVPSADLNAFVALMQNLLTDPKRCISEGKQNYQRAYTKLAWHTASQIITTIYARIL